MKRFFANAREAMVYWKMAVCRAVIYAAITGGSVFLTLTEKFTSETWEALGSFERRRIYIGVAIAIGGALLAFLDNTMASLRKQIDPEDKKATTSVT